MEFGLLSQEELQIIDGGSIWKYIGAVGTVAFGAFEVYTGIGAADGAKNIVAGGCAIIGGIYTLIS